MEVIAGRSSRFYVAMGLVTIATAVAGFGGSFYASVSGTRPLAILVHIHAAIFFGWLLLFLVQAGLVANRRTAVHRQLGAAATLLAVALVVVDYQTAIAAARRGYDLPLTAAEPDPLFFLVFSLGDLLSVAVLVVAAFRFRRRPDVHKRLMLLVVAGPMMAASLTHFWGQFSVPPDRTPLFLASFFILLFAGAVHDRVVLGRFHPVTLWGAVILFAWGNARALLIGPSEAWHEFAAWLIS